MKTLVITATLGESPWLAACVASAAHLPDRLQVLVAPEERVVELRRRFPGVDVRPEPAGRRGLYAALNVGAAAIPGWEALTYINDDDLLLPGVRRVAGAVSAQAGDPAIGYGHVRLIGAQGRRLGSVPVSPAPGWNRRLYEQRIEPVYQHGTVINRAAWERLGGFDETFRFCGDTELLARACLAGIRFIRIGGAPVAAFRLRPGQLTKNRAAMLAERAEVDRKLALLAGRPGLPHHVARIIFRLANLPAYLERIARFGWRSFDEVLERGS